MIVTEPCATPRNIEFIRGEPGLGIHRLIMGLNVTLSSGGRDQEAILAASGGDVFVQGAGGGPESYLGHLRPVGDARVVARSGHAKENVTFRLDLHRPQVEALEEVRQGGDFWLIVKADWRLSWADGAQERHLLLADWKDQVTQSDWARLRQEMGVARTLLVEVPAPDATDRPELAEAVLRWEEAHAEWLQGKTRDAVGKCREVLDALPRGPKLNKDLTQRLKDERIEATRASLMALCHAAVHTDKVCRTFQWERPDAEFAVSACAALLALYTRCPWAPVPDDSSAAPAP